MKKLILVLAVLAALLISCRENPKSIQPGSADAAFQKLSEEFITGYLFYSLGKLQMLKLREDYQKQEDENFSLQKFHDQLLENGMPPIRLLRERLLKDKTIGDKIL